MRASQRVVLQAFQAAYLRLGDALGVWIAYVALLFVPTKNGRNALQPVLNAQLLQCAPKKFASLVALVTFWAPYLPLLHAIQDTKKGGKSKAERDHQARAKALAHNIHRRGIQTVRLMDGHGRFLLEFLLEYRLHYGDEELNALTLQFVDVDKAVVEYHAAMFECDSIEHLRTNILQEPVPADASVAVYLNLCAIGDQWPAIKHYLHTNRNAFVMLTCTLARRAARSVAGKLNHAGRPYIRVESGRENCGTYIFADGDVVVGDTIVRLPRRAAVEVAAAAAPAPAPPAAFALLAALLYGSGQLKAMPNALDEVKAAPAAAAPATATAAAPHTAKPAPKPVPKAYTAAAAVHAYVPAAVPQALAAAAVAAVAVGAFDHETCVRGKWERCGVVHHGGAWKTLTFADGQVMKRQIKRVDLQAL